MYSVNMFTCKYCVSSISDCGKPCAIGTLNGACDTCICESTIIEGRILTTFGSPVSYATFAETSAPLKTIAESNSTGFFSLNATCLTSTIIASREGFQDTVMEIRDAYQTVYMELECTCLFVIEAGTKFIADVF